MSEVTHLPAKAPELKAGGAIKAVVPQSMDDAYRLAKAVCLSGLAPRGLEKPEAAMVAILHGLEIGLTPMMALQKISVINGRPTLWGDGALGLVRSSGLCRYVKESITGSGDAMTAVCETQRSGEPEPVKRTFSVADAKRAGLWGKQGPWQQYPARMLQMRARAFALRDTYADVLGGMYLAEELQGMEDAPRGHYSGAPGPRLSPPPAPALEAPAPAPEPEIAPIPDAVEQELDRASIREMNGEDAKPDEMADWVSDRIKEAERASSMSTLDEMDEQVSRELDGAGRDELRTLWNSAYSTRKAALARKSR